jgi:hypothetical protein
MTFVDRLYGHHYGHRGIISMRPHHEGERSMNWETPSYEVVEVCAEASGYLYQD